MYSKFFLKFVFVKFSEITRFYRLQDLKRLLYVYFKSAKANIHTVIDPVHVILDACCLYMNHDV